MSVSKLMKVWQHPTKNETRVYLNGMPYQPNGMKLYVERVPSVDHTCDWNVKAWADWVTDTRRARDAAMDYVEHLVGHGCTFDQIVAYANQL